METAGGREYWQILRSQRDAFAIWKESDYVGINSMLNDRVARLTQGSEIVCDGIFAGMLPT